MSPASLSAVITATTAGAIPSAPIVGTPTVTSNSVTLTWAASTGTPVPTYSVGYRPAGSTSAFVTFASGLTGLTSTVTGLSVSSSYQFEVVATNSAGTATSAYVTATTTSGATLASAPQNLALGSNTSSTLTLTWSLPASGDTPTGYAVSYVVSPYTATPTTASIGAVFTYTIVGLQPNTGYQVTVAAINGAGTGPASAALQVMTATGTATRSPFLQPGGNAGASPWNTPIGSGAVFSAATATDTVSLTSKVNTVNAGNYGQAIYVSTSSDPLVTFTSTGAAGAQRDANLSVTLRCPANAVPSPPYPGGDCQMSIYDTTISPPTCYSFGPCTLKNGSNVSGGVTAAYGEANLLCGSEADALTGNYGYDSSLGVIRLWELNPASNPSGRIRHVLRFACDPSQLLAPTAWDVPTNPSTGAVQIYWPQTHTDSNGPTTYTGKLPAGALVAIPSSTAMPAGLSAGGQMLFDVLVNYGAMWRDTASGGITFYSEPAAEGNSLLAGMRGDMATICKLLRVVRNVGPSTMGGGGTPIDVNPAPALDTNVCSGVAPPPNIPKPAASVGYNTQTYGPNVTMGVNWFNLDSAAVWTQNADGSLTVAGPNDSNAQVTTGDGHSFGTAFGGGFYAECDFMWTGTYDVTNGWPSFWANSVEGRQIAGIPWPGAGGQGGGTSAIELDIFEFWSDGWSNTLWDWAGASGTIGTKYDPNWPDAWFDQGGPHLGGSGQSFSGVRHKIGCLWVPATATTKGYVQFYLDGVIQPTSTMTWNLWNPNTAPPLTAGTTAGAIIDKEHLALILGSSAQNPMQVFGVSVWQKDGTQNLPPTKSFVPSPAANVGYNMQTFGPNVTVGSNWLYSNSGTPASAGVTQNSSGSVTIASPTDNNSNQQLVTANSGSGTAWSGVAFGGGAYIEITASWTGTYAGPGSSGYAGTGWPSFWSVSVESIDNWNLRYIEADFFEFWSQNSYGWGLHDSYAGTPNVSTSLPQQTVTDVTKPFTIGWLWVPATATTQGYAQGWYKANGSSTYVQVATTVTWNQYQGSDTYGTNPYGILDIQHLFLMMGTGLNPLTISAVSVWQKDASQNLSGSAGGTGPGAPASLATTSQSSNSVGLSWNIGSGTLPQTFTVQYSLTGQNLWTTAVTGLQPSGGGSTLKVPAQAAAVGYNTQTWGGTPVLGTNWFKYNMDGLNPNLSGAANGTNVITITNPSEDSISAEIASAEANGPGGLWTGIAFGGGGYFEATMSFTGVPVTTGGWPSFWGRSIESRIALGSTTSGGSTATATFYDDFVSYDSNKWYRDSFDEGGDAFWNNDPTYTPQIYTFASSVLTINVLNISTGGKPYTSGIMNTYSAPDNFVQQYGYFEVVVAVDKLIGLVYECIQLSAPDSGAFNAFSTRVATTGDGIQHLDIFDYAGNIYSTDSSKGFDPSVKHTYGLDWQASTVTVYVDNVKVASWANAYVNIGEFYTKMHCNANFGPDATPITSPGSLPKGAHISSYTVWTTKPTGTTTATTDSHQVEVDIAMFNANNGTYTYSTGLHDWYNSGANHIDTSNAQYTVPAGTDLTQPHKYGGLWVPATATTKGYWSWWFDGNPVGTTDTWNIWNGVMPPTANPYAYMDQEHLYLICGTGSGNPVTVYGCNVWQKDGTKNLLSGVSAYTPATSTVTNGSPVAYTVNGLAAGTAYDFRVYGTNTGGLGAISTLSNISTTGSGGGGTTLSASSTMSLSNGNLTATCSGGGTTFQTAVSTTGLSSTSGMRQFEVTLTTMGANADVGVATQSYNLGSALGLGGDSNGVGFCPTAGQSIFCGDPNTPVGAGLPGVECSNGDILTVIFDPSVPQIWCSTGAMRTAGYTYNSSPTANPATGAGGISLAGIITPGTYYIAINDSTTGATYTLNAGASAFSLAMPSNVQAWNTGSTQTTTLAGTPTVTVGNTTANTIALSWGAVTGTAPITYNISQSTTVGGTYTVVGTTQGTSFTAGSLTAGTTYYFKVFGVNAAGSGPNSSPVSGTTTSGTSTVAPLVTSPLSGSPTAGTWQLAQINGMYYWYLLPYNYSTSYSYPLLLCLHQLDQGTPFYTGGKVASADLVKPQWDPWVNNTTFRKNQPCIVVLPLLDQTTDSSGNVINWGGVTPSQQAGQTNIIALVNYFITSYSVYPQKVYVTGNSMGGIGSWDAIIKYNTKNPLVSPLFAAALILAGADYNYNYPTPTATMIANMKPVPIYAIHGAQDTQVPLLWDQNMYAAMKPSVAGYFTVKNGRIIDPNGHVFTPRGVNVWSWSGENALPQAITNAACQPLTQRFPGINWVRVVSGPTSGNGTAGAVYPSPSMYLAQVQWATGYTRNSDGTWTNAGTNPSPIVLEFEDHDSNSMHPPYTGGALTTQTNWYAAMAAYYNGNPYVAFGTQNEMNSSDGTYSTTAIYAMTASHQAIYNAIRGTGSKALLQIMAGIGGSNPGTVGKGAGYNEAAYTTMYNIIWEIHCYYSAGDSGPGGVYTTAAAYVNGGTSAPASGAGGGWGVAGAQTLKSADGVVPVIIGEWGSDSGATGTTEAAALVAAVQAAGVSSLGVGSTAWTWVDTGQNSQQWVVNNSGNGSLTTWGGEVAALVAAVAASNPITGTVTTSGGNMSYIEDPNLGHDVWDTYYVEPAANTYWAWLFSQSY